MDDSFVSDSSVDERKLEAGQPLLQNIGDEDFDKAYQVYAYRWITVALFVFSGVVNAMILLTWAPISNKADDYWDGIGLTAINLLNVIFQATYVPGTMLALRISEKSTLRNLLIAGGLLSTCGCFVRLVGVLLRNEVGAAASYSFVLVGTMMVGLAQPFYLNMPAKVATTWFGVAERDIGTTLCSLANPLGSAVGSFLPPMLVTGTSQHDISAGLQLLLSVQLGITAFALLLIFLLFREMPPTFPSLSARTLQTNKSRSTPMFSEVANLFKNQEYVKLFISFTIILGMLNALAALLNQLPGGYTNGQIGLTGAVLIMSGFTGAFLTGFVLDATKAYSTVLKGSYFLAFICWSLFMVNCRGNNFTLFLVTAAFLGFATLPTVPSTIVSAVECSYPIPEDASVGFLYIGANTAAIPMTFIGQILLTTSSPNPAPFFPFGIWVMVLLFAAVLPVSLFQGKYFRLEQDS
ncbi:major facilitator superfamily domain-containing protein [Ochromonadaceae sp. CCMP2298]|nr:major facilitator superfamily domain-containing protein [Ochromonadaceae sp. CCMP2298]